MSISIGPIYRTYPLAMKDNNNIDKSFSLANDHQLAHQNNGFVEPAIEKETHEVDAKVSHDTPSSTAAVPTEPNNGVREWSPSLKTENPTKQQNETNGNEDVEPDDETSSDMSDNESLENNLPYMAHSTPKKETESVSIDIKLPDNVSDTCLCDRGVPSSQQSPSSSPDKDLDSTLTPFYRQNSIIKDQLFKQFGLDPHGNFVCHIYEDIISPENNQISSDRVKTI